MRLEALPDLALDLLLGSRLLDPLVDPVLDEQPLEVEPVLLGPELVELQLELGPDRRAELVGEKQRTSLTPISTGRRSLIRTMLQVSETSQSVWRRAGG